jgi:hypothetical protein
MYNDISEMFTVYKYGLRKKMEIKCTFALAAFTKYTRL